MSRESVLGAHLAVFISLALSVSMMTLGGETTHASQTGVEPSQSVAEIAKSAANTALSLGPPKGNVKYAIDKKSRTFSFPTGESRIVLIKLPALAMPYVMKVSSMCNCLGFSKSIFVPHGAFLDSDFHQTRELAETEFRAQDRGGWQVNTEIEMTGDRLKDAYLFLYTDGSSVGRGMGRFSDSNGTVSVINWPVSRAEHGTIRFETYLPKK